MQDCIFCQVIAGKSPSYKVYEDDLFLGILSIFPTTPGHVLVLPKKHYQWVYDVPEAGRYWEVTQKITQAVLKAMKPKWLQYHTYGHIPHAHIHIFPRYEALSGKNFLPGPEKSASKESLTEIAEKIRKEII